MRVQRTNRAPLARLTSLGAVGMLAMLACQSVPVPEPSTAPVATSAPARALVSVPVPPFAATTVRFSADSAMKLSQAGRATVSAPLAPGLELSLWAPEGMVSDPIGISFDDRGRLYVTQTARTDRDEIDIRGHQDWMVPSITFKDIEDKRAFYQRVLAPENSAKNTWLKDWNGDGSRDWKDLTFHKEKLWRLEDTNGDGVADQSQLVLEDFNDLVSDVLHDVLAYKNDVYVTISPDLWRLKDTNNDGVFDAKESLSHGSGVHIGFGGHGHSSPLVGPDGRLYWKQGDLGVHIVNREGRELNNPNSGVILRANLDGTDEEIFARGLRNPQDFDFDEYGNLISPDNDGDHPGETERVVYIVDGMDSGWRINWQFGKYVDPDNNTYKVWMEESMFKPRFAGQAAWFTPPIAAWHSGPSGFHHNPGTALNDAWKGYFFNSVFTGEPSRASIQAFKVAPQGAGFRLINDTAVVKDLLVTGVRFGPDGALYLADWITGWAPKERGRIWKVDVPAAAANPLRAETKTLIAADFKTKSLGDLSALLRHADMRVRTKAQFELVDRGASAELLAATRQTDNQLARIHGMWGIGQLARKDARQAASLVPLLKDGDAEIRAQAAKLLGDVRYGAAAPTLVPMLRDASPRVRFFAAEALGRDGYRQAFQPIVEMLAANNEEDVYLRHAGALALSRIGPATAIADLATNPNRAVRIAAVVALRRLKDAGVARFLADQDEYIVTEAARAINDDGGIEGALPQLAAALDSKFTNEPFVRRAINANLRVGSADAAQRVAKYAGGSAGNDEMRAEAISVLGVWPKPSILDRVDGTAIGPMQRDSAVARAALAALVQPIFASGSTPLQVALAEAVGRLRVMEAAPTLLAKLQSSPTTEIRIAALRALVAMRHERVAEAVRGALQDREPTVRMAALTAIPGLNLAENTTTELLSSVIGKGSIAEQQSALQAMGQVPGATGREAMTRLVEQLEQGKLAPEIQLDVAEAARASKDPALIARLEKLANRPGVKPVEAFADALHGGDARRGARVVFQAPAAQCTRCHSFGGPGANVGPNLSGVASRLQREQLLEALVDPSARIAPGFGPVQLTLKNGKKLFGTLKEETPTHVVVDAGGDQRVAKSDIATRVNGPSAMPPMGSLLTRREIRDVVEYLSTLKAP
ncbi:MAG: HEAT repeat domain-containing protein [Gemmatimonadaceae bacterium]